MEQAADRIERCVRCGEPLNIITTDTTYALHLVKLSISQFANMDLALEAAGLAKQ